LTNHSREISWDVITSSLRSSFNSILHIKEKLLFMAKNFIKIVFGTTSHSQKNKKLRKARPNEA
jgi:hypothetical protein